MDRFIKLTGKKQLRLVSLYEIKATRVIVVEYQNLSLVKN